MGEKKDENEYEHFYKRWKKKETGGKQLQSIPTTTYDNPVQSNPWLLRYQLFRGEGWRIGYQSLVLDDIVVVVIHKWMSKGNEEERRNKNVGSW